MLNAPLIIKCRQHSSYKKDNSHNDDIISIRLANQDIGLSASVMVDKGMLTSPRHMIPPQLYPMVLVCPTLNL